MQRLLFMSATLIVCACAAQSAQTSSTSPRATASDTLNYAIRAQYQDSLDQAKLAAFFSAYNTRSKPLHEAGNYLGQTELLRELRTQFTGSEPVEGFTAQMLGTLASFLGQHREALRWFSSTSAPDTTSADTTSITGFVATPALDYIVRRAEAEQVVMINEAHHVAQHRALTLALLPRLRALGYTHFAAETLSPLDSLLNTRRYPVRGSGYYSNEPMFGEVLRTALRLGFILVPYESMGENSQDGRERGQANNLNERIFKSQPKAKVLIHAGYSHINEAGELGGAKPMAVRFREVTGIDPLTIDQTWMTERGDTRHDDPLYRVAERRYAPRVPVVLVSGDRAWSFKPATHDITVVQPRTIYRDGRPDWLWAAGSREGVLVPADVCGRAGSCVVEARLATESADAVPVDAILVGASAESRTLVLTPGRYAVTARDASGAVVRQWQVTFPQGTDARVGTFGRLFEFRSGAWVNLHHFLYVRSRARAGRDAGRPSVTSSLADTVGLDALPAGSRQAWLAAEDYYTKAWMTRDLTFDTLAIIDKVRLSGLGNAAGAVSAGLASDHAQALEGAMAAYRAAWWPKHDAANRAWIASMQPLLERYGETIAKGLEQTLEVGWHSEPIRVDVSPYTNWAGAYATEGPPHVMISSRAAGYGGSLGLEMLFHESSHTLEDSLAAARRDLAAESGKRVPYDLIHAIIFYNAGELTRRAVPGHEMYIKSQGLWDGQGGMSRLFPIVARHWMPHIDGRSTLREAMRGIIHEL